MHSNGFILKYHKQIILHDLRFFLITICYPSVLQRLYACSTYPGTLPWSPLRSHKLNTRCVKVVCHGYAWLHVNWVIIHATKLNLKIFLHFFRHCFGILCFYAVMGVLLFKSLEFCRISSFPISYIILVK